MLRRSSWPRPAAGMLAALAVLALTYAFLHSAAAAAAFALAVFLLVTLRQPRPSVQGSLPAVVLHRLASAAVAALVLAAGSAIFRSPLAGTGFVMCAFSLIGRYWPEPAPSLLADIAAMGTYLAIVAVWLWLTHGSFGLLGLVALFAAGTIALPRWKAREAGLPRTEKQWPRLLGPRPLP